MIRTIAIAAIVASLSFATPASAQVDDQAAMDMYGKLLNEHIAKVNEYPDIAESLEGTAIVYLKIDRDGTLLSEEIVQSSGHKPLDDAALAAVKKGNPYPPIPTGSFPGTEAAEFTVPLLYMK